MSLEEMLNEIEQIASGEKVSVAYCGGMDPKDLSAAMTACPDANLVAYPTYEKTYTAVVEGECVAAVVPIEKSSSGDVTKVLNLMFAGDLKVANVFEMESGEDVVRYVVLAPEMGEVPADSDNECFMLMFTVHDEVGGLAKAVNAISDHGFNMSTLRSKRMKGLPFNYYFYVEAQGNAQSVKGTKMLEALKEACPSVKVLGRYAG